MNEPPHPAVRAAGTVAAVVVVCALAVILASVAVWCVRVAFG